MAEPNLRRDLDALESEVSMVLADPHIPPKQRCWVMNSGMSEPGWAAG